MNHKKGLFEDALIKDCGDDLSLMKKPERLKIENRNFWYEFGFAKN